MSEDKKKLVDQIAELSKEVAKLKKLNLDEILGPPKRKTDDGEKNINIRRVVKPDWVKDWNRKNASKPAQIIVKTDKETGKTEKIAPVVLPADKALDVQHDPRKSPIKWETRPTDDAVAPRGLTQRQANEWLAQNPGNPLPDDLEGASAPKRKQMVAMNKVWKYRNFKRCANCEAFDTWEARTDPYSAKIGTVHAEIWCHTCGSVDFEVADSMPAHIGTWAPPKETNKQRQDKAKRRAYRWERATYALVQCPRTAMELVRWFREKEKYEAIDFHMMEIQLRQMEQAGLVLFYEGNWWDKNDHEAEMEERKKQ